MDLTRAFDLVCRGLALGWPSSQTEKIDFLVSVGLHPDAAKHVASIIDSDGCILEQIGVDKHAVGLIRSLHNCSWFSVKDTEQALHVSKEGRQGYRFGGNIFDIINSIALDMVRSKLQESGIALTIYYSHELPPWAGLSLHRVPLLLTSLLWMMLRSSSLPPLLLFWATRFAKL